MPPPGRNLAQGAEHEIPRVHPGMRKNRRPAFNPAFIINDVQIQRAGGIGLSALTAKLSLDVVQQSQQFCR